MNKALFEAAQAKFGEVIGFDTRKAGDFVFLIKRSNPTFADRPYMTVCGSMMDTNGASFYWGHYDMTQESAHNDFQERI